MALAAAQFPALPAWAGQEGPRWRITVSPGALAIGSRDLSKAERTHDRHAGYNDGQTYLIGADQKRTDMNVAWMLDGDELPDAPGREITEWSRKSRCRMTRRLCELDYTPLLDRPGLPAVITLTYPDDWQTAAPNGRAVKKHFKAFTKRWHRAWDTPAVGVWKLEFQHRGAPHFHLLTVPPTGRLADGRMFREWLSQTWADVVAHPDPEQHRKHLAAGTNIKYSDGLKCRDPKRIAVYFTKHGTFASKEYQNHVPPEWQAPGQGPGRFWGVLGLDRCIAETELTPQDATQAARVMRRWSRAQGVTREVRAPRTRGGKVTSAYPEVIGLAGAQLVQAHTTRRRKVRRRAVHLQHGRGWLSVNDGPEFAFALARYLTGQRE